MAAGDLDEQLIDTLRAVLELTEEDPRELRLSLAALLLEVREPAEAFLHCRALLDEGPDDLEALALAEEASLALGARDRASRYRRVISALERTCPRGPPGEVVQLRLVGAKNPLPG